jgi:hypothetical protein
VGHQDRGRAGVDAGPQHPQHRLAGLRVEGTGGLVGQHEAALADQGAGDRHPLLLAAGQLLGEPLREVTEAEVGQRREGEPAGGADRPAVEFERQRHVLHRGEAGQQVQLLEDVADPAPAHRRELAPGQRAEHLSLHHDLAPGRRVEAAAQVEQGRLARAGRAHDGHQFAGADGDRDPAQGVHGRLAGSVHAVHVTQFDDQDVSPLRGEPLSRSALLLIRSLRSLIAYAPSPARSRCRRPAAARVRAGRS